MSDQLPDSKTVINAKGKILIPVTMIKALGIHTGDEVLIKLHKRELRIRPLNKTVKRTQTIPHRKNGGGFDWSDLFDIIFLGAGCEW